MTGGNEFGPDFQRVLVRTCVDDIGLRTLLAKHVALGQLGFTDPASAWAWQVIMGTTRPSPLALQTEARRLPAADPMQPAIAALLAANDARDSDYVRQQVVEWARKQTFRVAISEAVQLWNKGSEDTAVTMLLRRVEELEQIRLDSADRGWFFEELDQRQDRRMFVANGLDCFPLGVEEIDKAMNGGLHLGELEVPFGYTGVGKTFWCVHRIFVAARMRRRAIAFVLEGGRAKFEDRLESRFAESLYSLVRVGGMDADTLTAVRREYVTCRQSLVIRGSSDNSDWRVTIGDIRGELTDLRSRYGWVPELIVIDYGDLVWAEGESEYARQKAAFRQMKSLAESSEFRGHRGYAVCAPSQAQRPADGADEKEHTLYPRDLAECWEKGKIADAVPSINRTNWEKQNQQARIYLGKYRDNEDGMLVRVATDYARGGFIVLGAAPPPGPPPPPPKGGGKPTPPPPPKRVAKGARP